jgi:DNA-binding MarR family transcriptional regulator
MTRSAAKSPPLTVSRPELLRDGSDGDFRRLVNGLLALSSRHEALRDGHAARIGLAGPAYTILITVRHLGAPVTVGGVAEHMKVTAPFITAETAKLVARGLLSKRRDLEDGRRVLLSVTPQGEALLAALAPVQRRVNDVEFAPLSARDFRALLRLVERLVPAADAALQLQSDIAAGERAA